MRKTRASFRVGTLFIAMIMFLLLMVGTAFAGVIPERDSMVGRGDSASFAKVAAAIKAVGPNTVNPLSLSSYYAGYVYLTSHTSGGTYSCQTGSSIYVSCRATDYNAWDYYLPQIYLWDDYTDTIVDIYSASSYVDYSYSGSAYVDTTGLTPSSGRYMVYAVLWDDYYEEIEDAEYFYLNVTSPHSVSASIGNISASQVNAGTNVSFSGSGTDSSGHGISAYQWRSSLDGVLSTNASFSNSSLSVGTHTIYFKAQCSNGTWSPEVSRTLTVNSAPIDTVSAAIDGISPSNSDSGQSISFSGHGTDSNGHGFISYQWRSSINGALSSNASFSTPSLSVGTHTIYFKAQCSNGTWSPEVSRTLTVNSPVGGAEPVTAAIDLVSANPANEGASISFSGHGVDPLGHGLIAYQWRSDMDGVLSMSPSFSTSSLSAGTHTIYFSAQCSNGVWSPEVSMLVTVRAPASTSLTVSGASSVYRYHYYKVSGAVGPSSATGRVKIVFKRYYYGKWHQIGTTKYATLKTGVYSYQYKPSTRGSWRAYVTYTGNSSGVPVYRASSTKYKSFTVK